MTQPNILKRDQFDLRYVVEGEGKPMLVIGNASYYPRTFSDHIRQHLKLVFMDHRGFGHCHGSATKEDFTLDKILDDVEHLRETLNLGKVIIAGHSGHSYMALEYAKKYPQNVSRVVMIGIAPDLSEASVQKAEQYWEDTASEARKAALARNFEEITDASLESLSEPDRFIAEYARNTPKVWYDFNYDCLWLWEDCEINMTMFNYMWGEVFTSMDMTRGLENFDGPVLAALGKYDYLVAPLPAWDSVRPHFKDLTIELFEKSGHTPQLEEPDCFDKKLLAWIQGT